MKKFAVAGIVVAVALVAVGAFAWEVPSSTPTSGKGVMETGGKMGLEKALNNKLEDANCTFKGNTSDTTCDLKKIGNELAAVYQTAKEKGYRVEVNIQTGPGVTGKKVSKEEPLSAYTRAQKVRDNLRSGLGSAVSSWDFNLNTTDVKDNKVALTVKVR